ncbi:MAG: hypothetical protein KGK07_17115, partial [Chloroflexota bacterium]|nr:hypothetical protein [Chloroflexota bacterium]
AGWKSQQVAGYETSDAANDGTLDAVADVESGDLVDEETGDLIDTSAYLVAVLPAESSSDFCAAYAGRTYTFDDAPSLDFPAHLNCIHYVVILAVDDPALL